LHRCVCVHKKNHEYTYTPTYTYTHICTRHLFWQFHKCVLTYICEPNTLTYTQAKMHKHEPPVGVLEHIFVVCVHMTACAYTPREKSIMRRKKARGNSSQLELANVYIRYGGKWSNYPRAVYYMAVHIFLCRRNRAHTQGREPWHAHMPNMTLAHS
jgi:hypothetical protein